LKYLFFSSHLLKQYSKKKQYLVLTIAFFILLLLFSLIYYNPHVTNHNVAPHSSPEHPPAIPIILNEDQIKQMQNKQFDVSASYLFRKIIASVTSIGPSDIPASKKAFCLEKKGKYNDDAQTCTIGTTTKSASDLFDGKFPGQAGAIESFCTEIGGKFTSGNCTNISTDSGTKSCNAVELFHASCVENIQMEKILAHITHCEALGGDYKRSPGSSLNSATCENLEGKKCNAVDLFEGKSNNCAEYLSAEEKFCTDLGGKISGSN